MKEAFQKEIKSPFSYPFEIEREGLYAIFLKASCKPGWKNKWWLKFKGILEDILDLHLDDEDLRVETDNIKFKKPKNKQGLFNSPAAFSGTKTLGKTKTVVFIIFLTKGSHTIKFIPDGSPYLESIEIEKIETFQKFISYLNTQAENENYYSWYTFTLVNLPLKSLSITAQAGMKEGEKDDDDLKVLINGKTQKNPQNHHPSSCFCGFTLKGKEDTLSKIINLPQGIHYIELFADKTPLLKTIKLIFQKEEKFEAYDPPKKEEGFNPQYVIKDSAFINSDSMSEEEIEGFLRQYGEDYSNHLYHQIFEKRRVSFWIKKFTTEFEINPKIILTKLQTEKQLILGNPSINPTQDQLDWALGVGKTDTGTLHQYKGFLTQLKEGCRIFRELLEELKAPPFIHKNVDGKPLTVLNRATYALYRYTPHIEGANLFYKVYFQFFDKNDLGGKI